MRKRQSGNVLKFRPRRRGKLLLPFLFILVVGVFIGTREQLPIDDFLRQAAQSWPEMQAPDNSSFISCRSLSAVDGDTVKCDGVNMRALGDGSPNRSGFDTPEIYSPKCQQELELGRAARMRMQELIGQPGVKVKDSGVRDRYQRPLVWVTLPSGRTAGSVLVSEGHARIWRPGYRGAWCD